MLIFHKWQFGFLAGALSSMLSRRVVVLAEAQCSGTNHLGNGILECFVIWGAWFRGQWQRNTVLDGSNVQGATTRAIKGWCWKMWGSGGTVGQWIHMVIDDGSGICFGGGHRWRMLSHKHGNQKVGVGDTEQLVYLLVWAFKWGFMHHHFWLDEILPMSHSTWNVIG